MGPYMTKCLGLASTGDPALHCFYSMRLQFSWGTMQPVEAQNRRPHLKTDIGWGKSQSDAADRRHAYDQ